MAGRAVGWIAGVAALLAPALGIAFERHETATAGSAWLASAAGPVAGDAVLAIAEGELVFFDDAVFAHGATFGDGSARDVAISPGGRVAVAKSSGSVFLTELDALELQVLGGAAAPLQVLSVSDAPLQRVAWLDESRILVTDATPDAWILDVDAEVLAAGPLALGAPAADITVAALPGGSRGFIALEDGDARWIDASGTVLGVLTVGASTRLVSADAARFEDDVWRVLFADTAGMLHVVDASGPAEETPVVLAGRPVAVRVLRGEGGTVAGIAAVESSPVAVEHFDAQFTLLGAATIPASPSDAVATADGRLLIADQTGDVHGYRDGPWLEVKAVTAVLDDLDVDLEVKVAVSDSSGDGVTVRLVLGGEEVAAESVAALVHFIVPGSLWAPLLGEGPARVHVGLSSDAGARDAADLLVDAAPSSPPIVAMGFGDEKILVRFKHAQEDVDDYLVHYGVGSAMLPIQISSADPFIVEAPTLEVGTSGEIGSMTLTAVLEGVPNGTELCVSVTARDATGRESTPDALPIPQEHCATAALTRGVARDEDASGWFCSAAPGRGSPRGFAAVFLLASLAGLVVRIRARRPIRVERGLSRKALLGAVAATTTLAALAPDTARAAEGAPPRYSFQMTGGSLAPSGDVFKAVYGDEPSLELGARLAWSPIRLVEVGLQATYSRWRGERVASSDPELQSGERARLSFLPVQLTLTARGEVFVGQWVVPYLGAGAGPVLWKERNLDTRESIQGDRPGFVGYGGVQLLLDVLEPTAAKDVQDSWGIDDSYLVIEGAAASNSGSPDLSGTSLRAGLVFAF